MNRLLTALLLIPTVVYIIFLGPHWLFQATVALLSMACFREYARIAHTQSIPVETWLGHALGLAFLFVPQLDWRLAVAYVMVLTAWSLRVDDLHAALPQAAVTLLGIVYIYGAWRCAIVLRESGPWWVMLAVSINWVGDSAAYFTGRRFGRHKLATRVSPAKTWEGAAASAMMTTLYGAGLLHFAGLQVPLAHAIALSFFAGVAGQFGDLVESAMKRGAGVKDSGHMLPGHGGWMDRLDSTLFSMPVVAFYLQPPL